MLPIKIAMKAARRFAGTIHVTALGWVLLIVVLGSLGLALFGSRSLQLPGLVVGVVALFFVAVAGFPGGLRGTKTFAPRDPRSAEPKVLDEVDDPAAWQQERERRERDDR